MIWENPFYIRSAEKTDTDENFLQLFCAGILSPTIKKEYFSMINFIHSTPGAGKTTLFKSLQPDILASLENNDTMNEFYSKAKEYNIIDSDKVKLLSCIISCAKNYDVIDSLFDNRLKKLVFFALLNCRITLLLLKSIKNLLEFDDLSGLFDITFVTHPDEFDIIDRPIRNGHELYKWAKEEERIICNYLDELSTEKISTLLINRNLFSIKLFEPSNILFKGEKFLNYTLVILDDVHKLTQSQRRFVVETLYTMRPKLGVWIGERIEALSETQIVTNDAIVNREYAETVSLEKSYTDMGRSFDNVLKIIANRRVKLHDSDRIKTFESCLDNSEDFKKSRDKLEHFIDESINKITTGEQYGLNYSTVIDAIINDSVDTFTKAIKISTLLILYNRDCAKRQIYLFKSEYTIEEFDFFYKNNFMAAKYYLCNKLDIPYYYGMEKLLNISSHNIEQFLAFTGEIFSNSVSKTIIQKRQTKYALDPYEQDRVIKDVAKARYEEITRRFACGEEIKKLLSDLCRRSIKTRNEWKNSYNGGTVTGVGILEHELNLIKENDVYKKLLHVLSTAISANYFEKRKITQSGQKWVVFYYNRWICVHFRLPLDYGGWFKSTLDDLNETLTSVNNKETNKSKTIEIIDYDAQT